MDVLSGWPQLRSICFFHIVDPISLEFLDLRHQGLGSSAGSNYATNACQHMPIAFVSRADSRSTSFTSLDILLRAAYIISHTNTPTQNKQTDTPSHGHPCIVWRQTAEVTFINASTHESINASTNASTNA